MFTSTACVLLVCFAPAPLPRPAPRSVSLGVTVLPASGGLMIDVVFVGSPAATAGLRARDVITSIDETPIRGTADLVAALRKCQPNKPASFVVQRGGDPDDVMTVPVKPVLKRAYCYIGATLNATRISTLRPESCALAAGIKTNDVILSVDGVNVASSQDVADVINKRSPGDKVAFVVRRDGEEKKFEVKLAARPGY